MKRIVSIALVLSLLSGGAPFVFAEDLTTSPIEEISAATDTSIATSTAATEEQYREVESPEEVQETMEVIIKFADTDGSLTKTDVEEVLGSILQPGDTEVLEALPDAESAVVEIAVNEKHIELLEESSLIEYVEPNYARASFAVAWADDTFADRLWALENIGQEVSGVTGTLDADSDVTEAWNTSSGTSTVVAVIDSGILYTHPDLNDSLWDGSLCVDDQGAALGNCQFGYDFADLDTDPLPNPIATTTVGHGTHVAGIIAAERNNGIGVVGTAPGANIMALKFAFDVASEIKAIDFARQNGAKIINASYGGESFSQAEYDAIERFTDAGGLFIAAAGNDNEDIDAHPIYPAAYDLPGIISVTATDQDDEFASFSNTGEDSVDLGAPGVRIASTFTDDGATAQYAYKQGTSMSAPYVAGTAALIWSKFPALTNDEVKEAILTGGDDVSELIGSTVTGKRLNADRALRAAGGEDVVAPIITLIGASTLTLTVGDTYTELGATATDNIDATTTISISGSVNTAAAGTNILTYSAEDSAGNSAREVTRTITVQNPASSGGGGGGGGSSRNRSGGGGGSSVRKKTTTTVVVPPNPARPALVTPVVPPTPVNTVPAAPFLRPLTVGSVGTDVTTLQQTLTARGVYSGPITGYFGPLTAAGVRAYQALHGLEQVGLVGPMTRQLLNQGL